VAVAFIPEQVRNYPVGEGSRKAENCPRSWGKAEEVKGIRRYLFTWDIKKITT
jgi:hypothetical protein